MTASFIVLMLALLMGSQPITTDLYLPSLPALAQELGAGMGQTQLTLTALLLSFGFSQLLLGPLADRFGRRPVLLGGMALYTLASVGNALAPDMTALVATRTLQGVAMGAAVVCARAMIRDLFAPQEGARVMAKALGGLGVIALLSPLVGGLLTPWIGWRWTLALLAVFGALVFALLWMQLQETRPAPVALSPRALWHSWRMILRDPTFLAWAGLQAASYGGLFTWLAASSFVFLNVYQWSLPMYGVAMASACIAYIAGTLWCRRLLPRLGLQRSVSVAAWITLAGGACMGLLGMAGVQTWWAFLLPHYLFMFAHGVHQPCAQTGSVAPFPQFAGTASALSGCMLTLVAFCVGAWLGVRIDGTAAPLVNGVWMWCMVIALFAWVPVRLFGQTPGGR